MKSTGLLIMVMGVLPVLLSAKLGNDTMTEIKTLTDSTNELFNKFCADCHAVNEEVYGPALVNIEKRREKAWIISFVLNQEEFMKTDSLAQKMYNNSGDLHPVFSNDLSLVQIEEILNYIKKESNE